MEGLDLEKNTLLTLIKQQHDDDYSFIDKIYLYVKDPNEAKYQHLIKKSERNDLQIICMMSIKILKSPTQEKNVVY